MALMNSAFDRTVLLFEFAFHESDTSRADSMIESTIRFMLVVIMCISVVLSTQRGSIAHSPWQCRAQPPVSLSVRCHVFAA